jgi:hypothetical protein
VPVGIFLSPQRRGSSRTGTHAVGSVIPTSKRVQRAAQQDRDRYECHESLRPKKNDDPRVGADRR